MAASHARDSSTGDGPAADLVRLDDRGEHGVVAPPPPASVSTDTLITPYAKKIGE